MPSHASFIIRFYFTEENLSQFNLSDRELALINKYRKVYSELYEVSIRKDAHGISSCKTELALMELSSEMKSIIMKYQTHYNDYKKITFDYAEEYIELVKQIKAFEEEEQKRKDKKESIICLTLIVLILIVALMYVFQNTL